MTVPDAKQRRAAELYHSHMRGWRDGAAIKAMRREFTEHATRPDLTEAYNEGYANGQMARRSESDRVSNLFGYAPSVLRLADESEGT